MWFYLLLSNKLKLKTKLNGLYCYSFNLDVDQGCNETCQPLALTLANKQRVPQHLRFTLTNKSISMVIVYLKNVWNHLVNIFFALLWILGTLENLCSTFLSLSICLRMVVVVGEVFSEQAYCPGARAKIDGKFQSLVRTPCCAAWPQNNIQAHTCKHTTRMPYFHVSRSACWCDDRDVVARRASRQSTAMKSCASRGSSEWCVWVLMWLQLRLS